MRGGWGKALGWGVVDQAVAVALPFAVALAAAWTLPPHDHGRLALMGAGLAAGLAVHVAVVLDPLTARGRARPATVGAALALWALLGLGATVGAWAVGSAGLGGPFLLGVAAAIGPALLLFGRRLSHLRGRPRHAAMAGFLALPPTLGLVLAATTAEGYMLALAGGAGAAGVLAVGAARPVWRWRVTGTAFAYHAHFGGWLVVAAVPWIVATQVPLIALAAVAGEAEAGALRVLLLLALPVAHLGAAMGMVVQPRLAEAARHGDVRRRALGWGAVLGVAALPWGVVLMVAPEAVVGMVFGAAYAGAAGVLPVVAATALLGALGTGPALALRAQRRGRAVAAGSVAGAVLALAGAAVLVPAHGLGGAAATVLVARMGDITVQAMALLVALPPGREATV